MKKITILIALMVSSLSFAQPTTNAPLPTKLAVDVISMYSDAYTNLPGVNLNPNWGQTGFNFVNATFNPTGVTTDPNYAYYLNNFNYQGIEFTGQNLVSSKMEKLHVDIWTPNCETFEVYLVASGGGEKQVTLKPTLNGWNSYDITLTEYSGQNLPLTNIFQFKFVGTPFGTSKVYLDNIYFWKTPAPAGTPVIGALTVPAKKVGDASFNLTDPTSDSPGSFSYTSSNAAVATISGKTVTIVGAGSSTITAIQAASTPFLTGSVTATLVVEAFPSSAAPTPPNRPAADVKSIFSNSYSPVTTFNYAGVDAQPSNDNTYDTSWSAANTTVVDIAGNEANKMTGLGFQGIAFLGGRIDASTFTTLHIDIWTATDTADKSFNLKLVNFNGGAAESNAIEKSITNASNPSLPNPNPGTWISYDIPLSTFTVAGGGNASRNDLAQLVITSNLGTVYYDNLYFHKNTLGTQKFEASDIKMYPNPVKNTLTISANSEIQKVSVRNILGQEVLKSSPRSNTATLQTNTLQKGVYMVTTEIDGKMSTSKVIKE